jgi:hypothetical protein
MDNCLNSDHLIGIRAKTAAEEVNRLRNWKRTEERFEENKARIKKDCLAVLAGMSAFSWEKYTAALEAKGYKVKLKLDASVMVRGYSIQCRSEYSDAARDGTKGYANMGIRVVRVDR